MPCTCHAHALQNFGLLDYWQVSGLVHKLPFFLCVESEFDTIDGIHVVRMCVKGVEKEGGSSERLSSTKELHGHEHILPPLHLFFYPEAYM